jgi:hypothetical protein
MTEPDSMQLMEAEVPEGVFSVPSQAY